MVKQQIEKENKGTASSKKYIIAALGCIFLSALICLGQITANMILIAAFFAGLLAICIWACMKDIILTILLYFLPWSPLMKFYKGGISFFYCHAVGRMFSGSDKKQNVTEYVPNSVNGYDSDFDRNS